MVHRDEETVEVELTALRALEGQDPHIDYRENAEPNEDGKIPASISSYEPKSRDGRRGTALNNDVYLPESNFDDDDLRQIEDRTSPARGWIRIRYEDVGEDRFLELLEGVEAYTTD